MRYDVFYVPAASIKAYQNAISSNNSNIIGAYFVDLPADTEKGTVTADRVFVPSENWSKDVTLTVTPKPGYKVKNVSLKNSLGEEQEIFDNQDGTYWFNMPGEDVTVDAEFEAAPTVNAANVTLGGELGLNFFLTVPDELVEAGAKAVLEGPDGKREFALAETPKDPDGDYKVTYKLKAIFADRKVSLKPVDSNGATIKLYKTSGAELDEDKLEYSIYKYVNAFTDDDSRPTEKELAVAKTMYSFGAYSAKWKFGTAVPEDVTAPKELDTEDFKQNELKTSGTIPDGIKLTALSLVLDSNKALRLYFTCTGDITACPVTLDGKALTVKPSDYAEGEYYVDIENIGAKKLKNTFDIKFGDNFTASVSPMSYVCNTLIDNTAGEDVMNVLKALCAYSDAVDEYVGVSN
ncbi:MAG: hypothetical protein K6B74_08230 [Ruminococcus sp.]|nr:hypothetical protein [Ruminococcus sp.]